MSSWVTRKSLVLSHAPWGCPLDDTTGPVRSANVGLTSGHKLSTSCLPPQGCPPGPPLHPRDRAPVLLQAAPAGQDPTLSNLSRPTFLQSHFTSCLSLCIYLNLSLLLGHFVCRAVEIRTSRLNICPDVKVLLVTTLLSMYM